MFPIDHASYLHLPAFLNLHTLIFLRSIIHSWHKSGRACVHCDHFEDFEEGCVSAWSLAMLQVAAHPALPFLCDSVGQRACVLHVGWPVCSPKDTIFLVNHCPAACFKFLFSASLIHCPQGTACGEGIDLFLEPLQDMVIEPRLLVFQR